MKKSTTLALPHGNYLCPPLHVLFQQNVNQCCHILDVENSVSIGVCCLELVHIQVQRTKQVINEVGGIVNAQDVVASDIPNLIADPKMGAAIKSYTLQHRATLIWPARNNARKRDVALVETCTDVKID